MLASHTYTLEQTGTTQACVYRGREESRNRAGIFLFIIKQYEGCRAASKLFQQSLPSLRLPAQTENCPLFQSISTMAITLSSWQHGCQTVKFLRQQRTLEGVGWRKCLKQQKEKISSCWFTCTGVCVVVNLTCVSSTPSRSRMTLIWCQGLANEKIKTRRERRETGDGWIIRPAASSRYEEWVSPGDNYHMQYWYVTFCGKQL